MTPYLSVAKARPDFEAFLFASIGDERNGMALSVLSGLSRLNIDPWDEAARLSQLPRAQAVEALGHRIGQLPHGTWQACDAAGIADRLVDLLPRHDAALRTVRETNPPVQRASILGPKTARLLWLLAAGLAAGLLFGLPARVEQLFAGDHVAPITAPASRPSPHQ